MLQKRLKGIQSLFQQLSKIPFGYITCKKTLLSKLRSFPLIIFPIVSLHFVVFSFKSFLARKSFYCLKAELSFIFARKVGSKIWCLCKGIFTTNVIQTLNSYLLVFKLNCFHSISCY